MIMKIRSHISIFLFIVGSSVYAVESDNPTPLKADNTQIMQWNKFAEQVYVLHKKQIINKAVVTKKSVGGYAQYPEYYIETNYFDKKTGLLLSRIQREQKNFNNIHLIEVFIYNEDNRLIRDYMAAYLPEYRNAPIQTLINFHYSDNELRSYRQFDASGNRIYEQCQGSHFDTKFMISLEEHEIPNNAGILPASVSNELYLACFNQLSATAGKYIIPASEIDSLPSDHMDLASYESIEKKIDIHTNNILQAPANPKNYIERAKLYFELHQFEQSIDDLTLAIQLDSQQDEAYFWRGMSLARDGQIDKGIADLDIYLELNPYSSRGYTKRGVRYIWKGDLKKAERDLSRAIQLDNKNAEAHDDLGVIYAQRGELEIAIQHFSATVKIDPSYQKAWHNLATAEFLSQNYDSALRSVNQALRLSPDSRNSLLLKGEILMAQGKKGEARRIIEEAEFLPEGNWSEQFPSR